MQRTIFSKNSNINIPHATEVLYWMSRDQRIENNPALLEAQSYAIKRRLTLRIIFFLQKAFLEANERSFQFMKKGLANIANEAKNLNISFSIIEEVPAKGLLHYITNNKVAAIFTDFSPLRIKKAWEAELLPHLNIPYFVVDAHNIVPITIASAKQEYAARTFRPKISKQLSKYLVALPAIIQHPFGVASVKVPVNFELITNESVHSQAQKTLATFIQNISQYELHNNPLKDATSRLSKFLHLGHISALEVALTIKRQQPTIATEQFLEELIVRKELSDNYCYYNDNYDNFNGFPNWAKTTLTKHLQDHREYIYSKEQFENAATHDSFWNSAQIEMMSSGYLNGYLRMYWAKKILEWSQSPEDAQKVAIYLNDKYQLDGRDPNGYTGIAWAIGGVHDRPWFERPVFGSIRYMNASGASKKFSISDYVAKVNRLSSNSDHFTAK